MSSENLQLTANIEGPPTTISHRFSENAPDPKFFATRLLRQSSDTKPRGVELLRVRDVARLLRLSRATIYYISVGRGGTTVTKDLIDALKSGQLGGAALDVTDPEPLPDGHPLWSAPNIIISPHSSSYGENLGGDGDRAWRVRRELIRRYAAGEKIYNVADAEKGF